MAAVSITHRTTVAGVESGVRRPAPRHGRSTLRNILLTCVAVAHVVPLFMSHVCLAHSLHSVVPMPAESVSGRMSQVAEICPPCTRPRKSNKKKASHILEAVCKKDFALGVRVVDLRSDSYVVEVFGVFKVTGLPLFLHPPPQQAEEGAGEGGVFPAHRRISLARNDSDYLTLNRPFRINSNRCSCPHLHVNKPYLIAGDVDLSRKALVLGEGDFSRRWNNRTMAAVEIGMRLCPVYLQSQKAGPPSEKF